MSADCIRLEIPRAEAEALLASLDAVFVAIDPKLLRVGATDEAVRQFRALRARVHSACSSPPSP